MVLHLKSVCEFRNWKLTEGARIPNLPFFYLVFRAWSHWKGESTSMAE